MRSAHTLNALGFLPVILFLKTKRQFKSLKRAKELRKHSSKKLEMVGIKNITDRQQDTIQKIVHVNSPTSIRNKKEIGNNKKP